MNIKDIIYIHDPWARMVQSHEFYTQLLKTADKVREIRDDALLDAREDNPGISHAMIGQTLGLHRQAVVRMQRHGRKRRTDNERYITGMCKDREHGWCPGHEPWWDEDVTRCLCVCHIEIVDDESEDEYV